MVVRRILLFVGLTACLISTSNICAQTKQELVLKENAFSLVAEQVGPAVVSVSVSQVHTSRKSQYNSRFRSVDPFLDQFLKEFFESPPMEFRQSGLGSGVIIDEKGYILTNEHVVGNADKIEVTLSDGRKYEGILKGADTRSDLAVIKIDAENLPVAKLGNSDNVKIGQWVVAIGNPFGFIMSTPQPTITVGVVSALHRSFAYRGTDAQRYYGNLIQTDAAINRGNSGGPLVNLNGEIVGISALIFSTTGGYQGIGFAIPINRAKQIIDELIAGKNVKYGWLGVQVQSVTPELIDIFKFPDDKGALIADVVANSPAEIGGLKKGDLIRKIDDHAINNSSDLVNVVSSRAVGEIIKIGVIRGGKETSINVKIGERSSGGMVISKEKKSNDSDWRGIQVSDLFDDRTKNMNESSGKGVIIVNIIPGTLAVRSGVNIGDIIDEVDRKEVKNTDDFKNITKNVKGESLIHTNRGYFVIKEK